MKTRIAINGFGRIGRLVYRALLQRNMLDDRVEVVIVNDLVPAKNLAYLLKYDSNYGVWPDEIKAVDDNTIQVGNRVLKTVALKVTPDQLPWKDYDIDLVIESTGHFHHKKDAEGHLSAGAKKVLISALSDPDVRTIVPGVNDDTYQDDAIVSMASCTTNCLAPIVHVLLREGIGIEEGLMLTAHSYTVSQGLVDGPNVKDLREGRSAAINLVPTSTGAAKAVSLVIPEVKGKLTGMALRVPTPTVSMIDLTFRSVRPTSHEEINALMKKASETYLAGVLGYTEDPVVSSDLKGNTHASIYDATASLPLNDRFFKLISWYDNELGYCHQVTRMIERLIKEKI